jgi:hypothetical protein
MRTAIGLQSHRLVDTPAEADPTPRGRNDESDSSGSGRESQRIPSPIHNPMQRRVIGNKQNRNTETQQKQTKQKLTNQETQENQVHPKTH